MDKELIYEKLPADIAERHVLLMDPILATGNSAVRAIQVVWCSIRHHSMTPAKQHCTKLISFALLATCRAFLLVQQEVLR